MGCIPSKDTDQPGHLPSLINLCCPHEEAMGLKLSIKCTAKTAQAGPMPRVIWVFAGRTGHFASFVMLQLNWQANCFADANYSHPPSFGPKYGQVSFFCKQMDIFQEKVYIFRKATSASTFFGLPVIKILSAWRMAHAASSKNRFKKRISLDQLYRFWPSRLLQVQLENIIIA